MESFDDFPAASGSVAMLPNPAPASKVAQVESFDDFPVAPKPAAAPALPVAKPAIAESFDDFPVAAKESFDDFPPAAPINNANAEIAVAPGLDDQGKTATVAKHIAATMPQFAADTTGPLGPPAPQISDPLAYLKTPLQTFDQSVATAPPLRTAAQIYQQAPSDDPMKPVYAQAAATERQNAAADQQAEAQKQQYSQSYAAVNDYIERMPQFTETDPQSQAVQRQYIQQNPLPHEALGGLGRFHQQELLSRLHQRTQGNLPELGFWQSMEQGRQLGRAGLVSSAAGASEVANAISSNPIAGPLVRGLGLQPIPQPAIEQARNWARQQQEKFVLPNASAAGAAAQGIAEAATGLAPAVLAGPAAPAVFGIQGAGGQYEHARQWMIDHNVDPNSHQGQLIGEALIKGGIDAALALIPGGRGPRPQALPLTKAVAAMAPKAFGKSAATLGGMEAGRQVVSAISRGENVDPAAVFRAGGEGLLYHAMTVATQHGFPVVAEKIKSFADGLKSRGEVKPEEGGQAAPSEAEKKAAEYQGPQPPAEAGKPTQNIPENIPQPEQPKPPENPPAEQRRPQQPEPQVIPVDPEQQAKRDAALAEIEAAGHRAPPTPQPRQTVDLSSSPDYVREELDRRYALAEKAGVIDRIEQLSAQRLTANQVTREIKGSIKGLDSMETKEVVQAVRTKLGIPSMDDKAEFATWITAHQQRQTQPKPDVFDEVAKGEPDALGQQAPNAVGEFAGRDQGHGPGEGQRVQRGEQGAQAAASGEERPAAEAAQQVAKAPSVFDAGVKRGNVAPVEAQEGAGRTTPTVEPPQQEAPKRSGESSRIDPRLDVTKDGTPSLHSENFKLLRDESGINAFTYDMSPAELKTWLDTADRLGMGEVARISARSNRHNVPKRNLKWFDDAVGFKPDAPVGKGMPQPKSAQEVAETVRRTGLEENSPAIEYMGEGHGWPRATDPQVGDTVGIPKNAPGAQSGLTQMRGKTGKVIRIWRTADAESPDGLLHLTLRADTGEEYGVIGRDAAKYKSKSFNQPVPAAPGGTPSAAKEPWMMTQSQYVSKRNAEVKGGHEIISGKPSPPNESLGRDLHRREVIRALDDGKLVPPEVLKDYPDLQKQAGQKGPSDVPTETAEAVVPSEAGQRSAAGDGGKDVVTKEEGQKGEAEVKTSQAASISHTGAKPDDVSGNGDLAKLGGADLVRLARREGIEFTGQKSRENIIRQIEAARAKELADRKIDSGMGPTSAETAAAEKARIDAVKIGDKISMKYGGYGVNHGTFTDSTVAKVTPTTVVVRHQADSGPKLSRIPKDHLLQPDTKITPAASSINDEHGVARAQFDAAQEARQRMTKQVADSPTEKIQALYDSLKDKKIKGLVDSIRFEVAEAELKKRDVLHDDQPSTRSRAPDMNETAYGKGAGPEKVAATGGIHDIGLGEDTEAAARTEKIADLKKQEEKASGQRRALQERINHREAALKADTENQAAVAAKLKGLRGNARKSAESQAWNDILFADKSWHDLLDKKEKLGRDVIDPLEGQVTALEKQNDSGPSESIVKNLRDALDEHQWWEVEEYMKQRQAKADALVERKSARYGYGTTEEVAQKNAIEHARLTREAEIAQEVLDAKLKQQKKAMNRTEGEVMPKGYEEGRGMKGVNWPTVNKTGEPAKKLAKAPAAPWMKPGEVKTLENRGKVPPEYTSQIREPQEGPTYGSERQAAQRADIDLLKKFVRTVPEFALDPHFTVVEGPTPNEPMLQFKDGGTFKYEPHAIGMVMPEGIKVGDRIAIDIEQAKKAKNGMVVVPEVAGAKAAPVEAEKLPPPQQADQPLKKGDAVNFIDPADKKTTLPGTIKVVLGETAIVKQEDGVTRRVKLANMTRRGSIINPALPLAEFAKQDVIPAAKGAGKVLAEAATGLRRLLAPQGRSAEAEKSALMLREHGAELAQRVDRAEAALRDASKLFQSQKPQANYDFIDRMERGEAQPDLRQEQFAKTMRDMLDGRRREVRALGKGKLEHFIEDYFPHIWKDPEKAAQVFGSAKRPLEGPKSFLKQRTIPTIKEGIKKGLEPISDNPVELVRAKIFEMDRYILGQRELARQKEAKLLKFVSATQQLPEGYARIEDKIATVYGPPNTKVFEAFDALVREKLDKVIAGLDGLEHVRKPNIGGGRLGYAEQTGNKMVTKFAGPEQTVQHELGHILDFRYGLWDHLTNIPGKDRAAIDARKKISSELRTLADMRFESKENEVTPHHKKYVRERVEKIANAVDALIYMPQRMEEVAPTVKAKLTAFFRSKPELAPILDIKPSLVRGAATAEKPIGGITIMGQYAAPEPVATVWNNYLSPGLSNNKNFGGLFRAWRGVGNTLNQAQLGISGFHLGFTSADAGISKFALAMQYGDAALRSAIKGEWGDAMGQAVAAGKTAVSTPIAPIANILRGNKLYNEWMKPGSSGDPQVAVLVDAMKAAGGRIRMDGFYRTDHYHKMMEAFRKSNVIGGLLRFPMAAIEKSAAPVLEYVVPRQKLGVFADMARFELEKLARENPDYTRDDLRKAMAGAWDSVDNRMGQLVYDNLFWNKAVKDLTMASVRSVGWNLGSIREIGGGVIDTARAGFDIARLRAPKVTRRMTYVASMTILSGLIGGSLHYLMTGKKPEDLKDYYFPQTGRFDAHGRPIRMSLPTYVKDVYHAYESPGQTAANKLHPLIGLVAEQLANKDFYGTEIRNADDPFMKQITDRLKHVGKSALPFSVRGYKQLAEEGVPTSEKLLPFIGLTKAPKDINLTKAEKLAGEMIPRQEEPRTKEQADKSQLKYELERDIRLGKSGAMERAQKAVDDGKLFKDDLHDIQKNAKLTPLQRAISAPGIDAKKAMKVWDAATADERSSLHDLLRDKILRADHLKDSEQDQMLEKIGAAPPIDLPIIRELRDLKDHEANLDDDQMIRRAQLRSIRNSILKIRSMIKKGDMDAKEGEGTIEELVAEAKKAA